MSACLDGDSIAWLAGFIRAARFGGHAVEIRLKADRLNLDR